MKRMIVKEENEVIFDPFSAPTYSLRPARFLTPSISHSPSFDLPISTLQRTKTVKNISKNVMFSGWAKEGVKKWKEWVNCMRIQHASTWHKAGIYEPIMNTTRNALCPDKKLIMGIVEKWCGLTNSFVFPWGEATLTLEDVLLISSYSLLGKSVLIQPLQNDTQVLTELTRVRAELNKTSLHKPSLSAWLTAFKGTSGHTEHVAFLVLWLSRHVFPFAHDVVGKHLDAMAVQLARGTRIALAPAVLASIYRDLTILKQAVITKEKNEVLEVWGSMHLVQIWAWERIPKLRPQNHPQIEDIEPRTTQGNSKLEDVEPIMARWNKAMTKWDLGDVRSAIDSSSESFIWRPYAAFLEESEKCWPLQRLYPAKEKWVPVVPGMREVFKSFAKIVSVSELVGIGCIEPYFPHRVAMQFGIDQDIPGQVAHLVGNPGIAWRNYDRLILDEKLYIPSRLFRSGVTRQYLEWWEQMKPVKKTDKDSKKRKAMTKLSDTTPKVHSSKLRVDKSVSISKGAIKTLESCNKKRTIIENTRNGCKKLKVDKSVLTNKGAAVTIGFRKKERSCKQRVKRTDWEKISDDFTSSLGAQLDKRAMENDKLILKTINGNKTPDDCMSSTGVEFQKEAENDKQPLQTFDRNEIPNDWELSSYAELQEESRNSMLTPKTIDGYGISDYCMSDSCAKSLKEMINDEQRAKKVHGKEILGDDRLSRFGFTGHDLINKCPLEPTEVVNEDHRRDECSRHGEPQKPSSSTLVCKEENDMQTVSHLDPTEALKATIPRSDETGKLVIDGDRVFQNGGPQKPSPSPLVCKEENDVQTVSHLDPTEAVKYTIPRSDETAKLIIDGDRVSRNGEPQKPSSSLLVCKEENDVQTVSHLDPTEAVKDTIPSDETGKLIIEGNRVSQNGEPQKLSSSLLVCKEENDVQTVSHLVPTEAVKDTIPRNDETGKLIIEGNRVSQNGEPQKPSSSLLVCKEENDVQTVSHLVPTEAVKDTIPRNDETGKLIIDGYRVSQKQSLTRRDEAVVEDAVEGRVIGGGSGLGVNNNQTEANTISDKLRMLRKMPLEARISRLERIMAQLIEQRKLGARSVRI